jgi:predicted CXXCH cytochrome family protein
MCTACHFPHQSDSSKLLHEGDLCFDCHDKSQFTKANIHPPAAGGMCLTCHNPHASAHPALALNPINDLCTTCHSDPNIKRGLHVVSGFGSRGHPLSDRDDPKRQGRQLACSSCHNPHSSEWMRLFRYQATEAFGICKYCHEKYGF